MLISIGFSSLAQMYTMTLAPNNKTPVIIYAVNEQDIAFFLNILKDIPDKISVLFEGNVSTQRKAVIMDAIKASVKLP